MSSCRILLCYEHFCSPSSPVLNSTATRQRWLENFKSPRTGLSKRKAEYNTSPQIPTIADLLVGPDDASDPEDLRRLLKDAFNAYSTPRWQTIYLILDGIQNDILNEEGNRKATLQLGFLQQLRKIWRAMQSKTDITFRLLFSCLPQMEIHDTIRGVSIIYQEPEQNRKWSFNHGGCVKVLNHIVCLSSLYFNELWARRERVTDSHPGTNEWIWSNQPYAHWQQKRSGILWIQGKSGSGKSTLSKLITQELIQKHKLPSAHQEYIEAPTGPRVLVDFFYSARVGPKEASHSWCSSICKWGLALVWFSTSFLNRKV